MKQRHHIRAGVEGTMYQASARTDVHRARSRGLAKTNLEQRLNTAALNLYRLDTWWTDTWRELFAVRIIWLGSGTSAT